MAKRGAEKDLNKDNADFEEADVCVHVEKAIFEPNKQPKEEPSTGFVRANDEEISRRRIAGLPRRAQSATRTASPNPPPTSKFIGFSSSSSPLFAPLPTTGTLTPPTAKVTSTATSTAKTFASFLDSTTSFGASLQSTLPSSSDAASKQDDPSLLKYYTSLRGLNVSLLAALTQATQEDPFVDISDVLNRYKSLRLGVQNEFEESSKSTPHVPAPEKPAFAPPAPPSGGFSGFGGFAKLSSSSTEPEDNKGGFQPQRKSSSPSSDSPFSVIPVQTKTSPNFPKERTDPFPSSPFGSSTSSSLNFFATSENNSLSPSAKHVEEKNTSLATPFTLGACSTSSEKTPSTTFPFGTPTSTNKAPSTTFSFGTSSSTDKAPSTTFLSDTSTSTDKTPSSAFSFGVMPSINSSSFSFGKTGNCASTSFGSTTSPSPFGKTNITTASESPATPKVPSFGSFGKPTGPSGSIGNPVGFAFGAPMKTQESDVPTGSSSDKKEDTDEGPQVQTDGAVIESSLGLITKNPHDEEGKGEEDEDTLHDARSKVFKLNVTDSGSSWNDLGVGIFRIKKHRETGARRILLRNSGTGKIVLNFKLYSGLKPTQNKKTLTFVGHDETGASQTYTVRLADEQAATTLREVLQKEIASTDVKSDD